MFNPFEILGLSLNAAIVITIIPLLIGLIGYHFLPKNAVLGLIILFVISALAFELLFIAALPSMVLIIGLCAYFGVATRPMLTGFVGTGILVLSVLFMLHLLPGFNNPIVIDNIHVSQHAPAFKKYLNFDKAILGLILLWLVVPRSKPPKMQALIKTIMLCTVAIFASFSIGLITGLVYFDPKLPSILAGWIITNLFLTCFVEEAFFRGFIQQQLQSFSKGRRWQISCIFISGGLFGLAHFPGGLVYCVIASIMGIAYAYSYYKSQNIYLPIAVHFIFNLLHFTLFTYPYVAH